MNWLWRPGRQGMCRAGLCGELLLTAGWVSTVSPVGSFGAAATPFSRRPVVEGTAAPSDTLGPGLRDAGTCPQRVDPSSSPGWPGARPHAARPALSDSCSSPATPSAPVGGAARCSIEKTAAAYKVLSGRSHRPQFCRAPVAPVYLCDVSWKQGLGRDLPLSPVWRLRVLFPVPQDAFQEEYYRTGTFPETPMVPPRRPWTLVNWLFWASLVLYPFFQFLVSMIRSGSSLTLASFILVFFVASMGVRWMIGVTEIDKGSAYGNSDSKQKQND